MPPVKKPRVSMDDPYNYIFSLPIEIILCIAVMLPHASKKNLGLTCSLMWRLMEKFFKIVWKPILENPPNVDSLRGDLSFMKHREMEKRFPGICFDLVQKGNPSIIGSILKSSLPSEIRLHLTWFYGTLELPIQSKVKKLSVEVIGSTEHPEPTINILGISNNLESLSIDGYCVHYSVEGNFDGLSEFKKKGDCEFMERLSRFLKGCKNLKKLVLDQEITLDLEDLVEITKIPDYELFECSPGQDWKFEDPDKEILASLLKESCTEKKREEMREFISRRAKKICSKIYGR